MFANVDCRFGIHIGWSRKRSRRVVSATELSRQAGRQAGRVSPAGCTRLDFSEIAKGRGRQQRLGSRGVRIESQAQGWWGWWWGWGRPRVVVAQRSNTDHGSGGAEAAQEINKGRLVSFQFYHSLSSQCNHLHHRHHYGIFDHIHSLYSVSSPAPF